MGVTSFLSAGFPVTGKLVSAHPDTITTEQIIGTALRKKFIK
jgi:hypothetical protein